MHQINISIIVLVGYDFSTFIKTKIDSDSENLSPCVLFISSICKFPCRGSGGVGEPLHWVPRQLLLHGWEPVRGRNWQHLLGHQVLQIMGAAEDRVLPERSDIQVNHLKSLHMLSYLLFLRLAAMNTKKENDCIAKYIYDEYKDDTSMQYAIGNICPPTK